MTRSRQVTRKPRAALVDALLTAGGMLGAQAAWANCTTVGLVTTCNSAAPNPWTSTIGAGPDQAAGASVIVEAGATVDPGNASAISLGDDASITIRSGGIVRNASSSGRGRYDAGNNTVEFRANGTLTIEAGAQLLATGTLPDAEAVNLFGDDNTLVNRGSISATNAAGIWFDGSVGRNTIDNFGTIESQGGNGNAFGGTGAIDFYNRETGVIRGSLQFGSGNDNLFLYTGSVITGALNANAGTDAITLRGVGTASIPGALTGFEVLNKEDSGTWALTGSITGNMTVGIGAGTLVVDGDNTGFTGTMTVSAGATLQGDSQSLTPTVTNNGLVRFDQDTAGTYAGVIQGTGAVTKIGSGTLILSGTNTYAGATTIGGGTVQVANNGNLGNAAGLLILDGGILRTSAGFDTARTTTIGAGGGTFDTASGTTLIHGGMLGGAGALTKSGAGTLVLSGNGSWGGATTLSAGTLQIGNGGTTGSLSGNVLNNAAFAVNRSDTFVFGGAISGTGQLHQLGPGTTVLTADNTYSGTTLVGAGTLRIGAGGTTGAIVGNVNNNGALIFDRSDGYVFGGSISGTGAVTVGGTGTMVFTANNTYSGTTSVSGTLQLGNGGSSGTVAGPVALSGTLVFDRNDELRFAGPISGAGQVRQAGSGTTVLTGINTYTGLTDVVAGTLRVDGTVAGDVDVQAGATLGGAGTIAGAVEVFDGAHLNPGGGANGDAGTLHVGSLLLDDGALVDYDLGTPDVVGGGVNDLVDVDGDLTLDGTLNITDIGGFGTGDGDAVPGVYRLFDYGGALTDNGLAFGALPTGFDPAAFLLQTSVTGQVNLVVLDEDFTLQFWDGSNETPNGAVGGGDGTWANAASNWTNAAGEVNTNWRAGFAVFQGTAGTVTLGEDVDLEGMQFATDGYRIAGNGFALHGGPDTLIRVSDGTAVIDATIADGSGGAMHLTKTDDGVLVLGGVNTYTGGTTIAGGALQVGADAHLGAGTGTLAFDGGALVTTGTFASTRAVTLQDEGGTVFPANGTTLTLAGTIDGTGMLRKSDGGTLVLGGTNTYTGGTLIEDGVLEVSEDANLGDAAGVLAFDGGTLHVTQSLLAGEQFLLTRNITLGSGGGTFDIDPGTIMQPLGEIGGDGMLTKTGAGLLILANVGNTYGGGTAINGGTVGIVSDGQLGAASSALRFDGGTLRIMAVVGTAGTSARAITLNAGGGTLEVDNGTLTLSGTIDGVGRLTKTDIGTLVLTGANTYGGGTRIVGGTLQVGDGGTSGTLGNGDVINDGTLAFDRTDDVTFAGTVSGTGALQQRGTGTLVLTGANSYGGGTSIGAGTLRIGDGGNSGSIVGDVANEGALVFNRAGTLTLAGVVSGGGSVHQSGTGVVTLSGRNTYTGDTFLEAGTLRVGADEHLGDATSTLVFDGGTLRLGADFDSGRMVHLDVGGGAFEVLGTNHWTGAITGPGALDKIGAGTLVLDADANVGATHVLQGALVVGDSTHAEAHLTSTGVTVAAGAMFGGYGHVSGSVQNFGVLGVGNAMTALAGEADARQAFGIGGNLVNQGLVTMANGATSDRLVVSDDYVANGGVLELDAAFDTLQADRLQAGGIVLGGAPTGVVVQGLGGGGAPVEGDGIALVEVADPDRSAPGAFELIQRAVSGPYEYLLVQGSLSDPANGQWYLRSQTPDAAPEPIYRPEIGAYLGNRRAVSSALVHTMYDRLGETPARGPWLRMLGDNVRAEALDGRIDARGGRSLFQLGADVLQWGRFHVGGMLAYARSDVDVDVHFNPAHAQGRTEGTLAGVFATWFADDATRLGAYVDTWAQVGRFDNEVQGETLVLEEYDADAWAVSGEVGYAFRLGRRLVVEPQLQAVHTDYSSDPVLEANGTRVDGLDDHQTLVRAGVRLRAGPDAAGAMRPFAEVNWWHGSDMAALAFNDRPIRGGVPDDRYEAKVGLQARLGQHFALSMQFQSEWGAQDYRTFQGQVGLHARW